MRIVIFGAGGREHAQAWVGRLRGAIEAAIPVGFAQHRDGNRPGTPQSQRGRRFAAGTTSLDTTVAAGPRLRWTALHRRADAAVATTSKTTCGLAMCPPM